MAARFTAMPTSADDQHQRPSTSGGSASRRTPSYTITTASATSVAPFSCADRISARRKPNVNPPRAGRRAEPGREQRKRDRAGVGEHVRRVREQGERGGRGYPPRPRPPSARESARARASGAGSRRCARGCARGRAWSVCPQHRRVRSRHERRSGGWAGLGLAASHALVLEGRCAPHRTRLPHRLGRLASGAGSPGGGSTGGGREPCLTAAPPAAGGGLRLSLGVLCCARRTAPGPAGLSRPCRLLRLSPLPPPPPRRQPPGSLADRAAAHEVRGRERREPDHACDRRRGRHAADRDPAPREHRARARPRAAHCL